MKSTNRINSTIIDRLLVAAIIYNITVPGE